MSSYPVWMPGWESYIWGHIRGSMASSFSIIDSGVFEPCNLPNLDIVDGVIVGSGVFEYKRILIEKYQDQKVIIDENEYPLAGAIAQLSIKRLDKNFNLKNAAPIYIRNNVAKTISERKIDLKAKERKL